MAYQKPLIGALSLDSENCGCCFYVNNSGQGFYVYNGDGSSRSKDIASVGDNSVAVTPLCGTGLPATQPITFGVPIGATGIHANVGQGGPPQAGIDASHLGVSVLGHGVGLGGLPAAIPLPHL